MSPLGRAASAPDRRANVPPHPLDRLLAEGRPVVMGILNVTPDSFSDGGRFLEPETAIAHARRMIAEGADMLDVGAESTRPYVGAVAVSREDELKRLEPVLAAVAALGVLGTGISFVLFYGLIGGVGPTRASLVAYIAPGCAGVYGVTLLGEDFGALTALGLVLIVGGSWLASHGRRPIRRRVAA